MQFTKAGIILFTEHYDECVSFYRDTLRLEVLHAIEREGEMLTAFDIGGTYLMVESGGIARTGAKTLECSPVKFRFNVTDVNATSRLLRRRGVAVDVVEHTWGTTAEFCDPDGNRCALRSDEGFGI